MVSDKPKILIVDDEQVIRDVLSEDLGEREYDCTTAYDGNDAAARLKEQSFDVALLDIRLPGLSGLELLTMIRSDYPSTLPIMITAVNDVDIAVQALRDGAYDYIRKPFNLEEVAIIINSALERKRLEIENEDYRQHLEEKVAEQTEIIISLTFNAIKSLVHALEAKDKYTSGHSQRVSDISTTIATEMGLEKESLENIRLAGLLHDLGKIGIRESVLNKPDVLEIEEYQHVKEHPEIGEYILAPIAKDNEVLQIIRHHHERYDGSGYPDQLKAEQIPLGARILAVADAYEAMTSERPYRERLSEEKAVEEIKKGKGIQFDPEVTETFFRVREYIQ